MATGAQTDANWRVDGRHTLRAGFLVQGERTSSNTSSAVLPLDAAGNPTTDQAVMIDDGGGKTGRLYGI